LQPTHAAPICSLPLPALLLASPRWDYSPPLRCRAGHPARVLMGRTSLSRKVR
jgi:hypothetical protein